MPERIIGRLGGEEFAAILPGADLSAAAAKAECVRAAFADMAAVIDGLAGGRHGEHRRCLAR